MSPAHRSLIPYVYLTGFSEGLRIVVNGNETTSALILKDTLLVHGSV